MIVKARSFVFLFLNVEPFAQLSSESLNKPLHKSSNQLSGKPFYIRF